MKVRMMTPDGVDKDRGYTQGKILNVENGKSMDGHDCYKVIGTPHLIFKDQVEPVELPKSFACKNTNQELWDKYITWLNKTYDQSFSGVSRVYPYYGITRGGILICDDKLTCFDVILDLEEWDEIVNGNSKIENKMEITREQLKSIHDVACDGWKKRIEKYAERNPFGNTIEFTQGEINEMFFAATDNQVPILESIFGKQQKELDFISNNIEFKVDGIDVFGDRHVSVTSAFISLPDEIDEKNGFYLNPNYDWTLKDGFLSCFRK